VLQGVSCTQVVLGPSCVTYKFLNILIPVSVVHSHVVRLNPSSLTMALWLTQPLTEMIPRILPGGKGQLAHKADSLTAICELIV
jgi:hypothetical protein